MNSKTFLSSRIANQALRSLEPTDTKRSLVQLIYLGKFLEAFVLHDELEILDCASPNDYDDEGIDAYMKAQFENSECLAGIWDSQGIHIHTDGRIFDSIVSPQDHGTPGWHLKLLMEIEKEIPYEFSEYEVTERYLDLAHCKEGISYTMSGSASEKLAQELFVAKTTTSVNLVEKAYQDLSDSLKAEIVKLSKVGRQIDLFLPPIPAVIFSRAGNENRIADEALILKEEMSSYRKAMSSYSRTIRDDSLSLRDSLSALSELESTVSSLFPRNHESWSTQISEWRDLAEIGRVIDGVSATDSLSLTKLILGKPLAHAAHKFKTRHVSSLSKVGLEFLKITGYGRLLQDTFCCEFSSKQLEYVAREWSDPDNIIVTK